MPEGVRRKASGDTETRGQGEPLFKVRGARLERGLIEKWKSA